MNFSPEKYIRESHITWDKAIEWFPGLRFAIIACHPGDPPRFIVERASPEQLRNFPDLQGKICYEHVNGFDVPCPWCPVVKSIEDRGIHTAIACSPKPSNFYKKSETDQINENCSSLTLLLQKIESSGISLSQDAIISYKDVENNSKWVIKDKDISYLAIREGTEVCIYPRQSKGSSYRYQPDCGEMVYSILVSIPLLDGEDNVKRFLEVSFERSEEEETLSKERIRRYAFTSNLCRSIEMASNDNTVNEFILLGAVAQIGLGAETAHIFLTNRNSSIDEDLPKGLDSVISERISLTRKGATSVILEDISNRLLNSSEPLDLALLRGEFLTKIHRHKYDPPRTLREVIPKSKIIDKDYLEKNLRVPASVRYSSRGVATPIISKQRRFHGLLISQFGKNGLVLDSDLVNCGIFSLFVGRALASRDLSIAFDEAGKKLKIHSSHLGDVAEDLVITSGVITGLGHDLRVSNRRVYNLTRIILDSMPDQKKESEQYKPFIKELQEKMAFQKKCLDRITDTALASRPVFLNYDIAKIIEDVKNSFKAELDELNIKMEIRNWLTPKNLNIECDEYMIRQTFSNILDNSIYWLRPCGKKMIEVTLENNGEKEIKIEFKDTGPDIADQIRDRIFDSFFTMKPGSGLGLGLSICKRILQSHKGSIELFRTQGWKACFRIVLPIEQSKTD